MLRYLTAALFVIGASSLSAQTPGIADPVRSPTYPAPQAAAPPTDYSKAENWLCRPGRTGDACGIDLTTSIVSSDGKVTRETFTAHANAPIDCFYVYPTVSA